MRRVGLTGGIACGKSHVLRRLAARGCLTLDLDAVAREVTAPGTPALAEIAREFGPSVLDAKGALDRGALAGVVFGDEGARARLNHIVHPRVRAAEAHWAESHAADVAAVLVTDGALLIESGAHLRFDRLVVVHCRPELQLARLRQRDGLDERAARARVEAQLGSPEKQAFAHFEVDSSGSPADTDAASDALAEELMRLPDLAPANLLPLLPRLVGGIVHGEPIGPRGLRPARLLELLAGAGGLELETLAERLEPQAGGPWYRAARRAPPGAKAASLGAAIVAWALAARAPDPEYLVAAAASLARLTHEDAAERADACLFALLLQEVALGGEIPRDLEARAKRLAATARRWGGGDPSGTLGPVLAAVLAGEGDPGAARAVAAATHADAGLSGALAGMAHGAAPEEAPALADALRQIASHRAAAARGAPS